MGKTKIKPKKALLILCLLICANTKAESVFSLDLKTDIIINTLAIGVFTSSFFIENPPSQIPDSLTRSDVNSFDRFFMLTSQDTTIRRISDVTLACMYILPLIPAFSVMDNFNANILLTYSVMYAQTAMLAFGTERLIKNNVTRFRPFLHDGRALTFDDRNESFPSGHTTMAFMSATFFATAFSLEHPDSRWKWPLIIGSHSLAASVGTMRVVSGMHFVTDVLAGAVLGSLFGWVVPALHRNPNSNFSAIATGNGLLLSLRF